MNVETKCFIETPVFPLTCKNQQFMFVDFVILKFSTIQKTLVLGSKCNGYIYN